MDDLDRALRQAIPSLQGLKPAVEKRETVDAVAADIQLDMPNISLLLQDLFRLLETSDSDAENRFRELKDHIQGSFLSAEMTELETCMGNYDFDKAIAALEKIGNALNLSLNRRQYD